MQTSVFFSVAVVLTATFSSPLLAADKQQNSAPDPQQAQAKRIAHQRLTAGYDRHMQTVANEADANAPAYGWRYFTDPATPRAVVISPQGDYYYSRGKGLEWVAAEQY